jgi:hypothetical protein
LYHLNRLSLKVVFNFAFWALTWSKLIHFGR